MDGAADYGNERQAGEGLARAIKDGIVTREDVFVTSKLWVSSSSVLCGSFADSLLQNTYHAREHVLPAARRSLADWGLEYFDAYLIHFPIALQCSSGFSLASISLTRR